MMMNTLSFKETNIFHDNQGRPYAVLLTYEEYERLLKLAKRSEAFQTMLASEAVLRRDWDLPEEDEAWADL